MVLSLCEVASSTWNDFQNREEVKPPSKSNKRGRPIPGFTTNPNGTITPDHLIVATLEKYRERPEFSNGGGYQKLKHYLKRDYGIYVNHKKLYRLCKEHKLLLPRNRKKVKINRKITENRIVYKPNQLWEFDIKYGYVHGENRHFYLLSFVDVFDRRVVNYYTGLSCKAEDLKTTFQTALENLSESEKEGLVIRSDNGPQMTSIVFAKYIDSINGVHEFIPPGDCNKNAHVESFNSIIETEFFQVWYFETYSQAYKETYKFIQFYNEQRIHGSLNMMSPVEFTEKFSRGETQILDVSV